MNPCSVFEETPWLTIVFLWNPAHFVGVYQNFTRKISKVVFKHYSFLNIFRLFHQVLLIFEIIEEINRSGYLKKKPEQLKFKSFEEYQNLVAIEICQSTQNTSGFVRSQWFNKISIDVRNLIRISEHKHYKSLCILVTVFKNTKISKFLEIPVYILLEKIRIYPSGESLACSFSTKNI